MTIPESQKLAYPTTTESSDLHNTAAVVPKSRSEENVGNVLLGWWRELLALEQVGLNDDFFDLGGHSLVGAELFARIKDVYGLDLGLSILFEARTVRELARYICETPGDPVAASKGRPDEDVEKVLLGWWRELLALEQVGLDDDFFDLGGHSLVGAELFARIKDVYGLDLGLSILFEARTVRELARYICEASCKPDTRSALVAIQPKGSRPPVFWLPGGYGTTTLAFKEVSLLLGPDQPVYGFEAEMPAPDELLESIPERAARFIKEMRSVRPEGPYSFIGFCSGGYTAYEMARQLNAAGERVAVLAIVDCYSEHHPNTSYGKLLYKVQRTAWRTKRVLARGAKGVVEWVGRRTKSFLQSFPIHVRRVSARLSGAPLPKLPSEVEDTFVKLRVIIDAYHQQLTSYPGKSVVFIGKDSYKFCGLSSSVDPRLIWCKLTTGGSEVRRIPGDHTDLLEAPMMFRFAEELKSCLDRSYGSIS